VRASWLEAAAPGMIERAIVVALTPLRDSIDALTVRVEVYERGHGFTEKVTALKTDISELRKDVGHLKSIDFTSIFGTVEIPDGPSTYILTCSEVRPTTTGDEVRGDDTIAKSEAENDEEQLGVRDEAVYDELADLEGVMFETARQESLQDDSMVGSSRANNVETPGSDPQIDGARDMQKPGRMNFPLPLCYLFILFFCCI